MLQEMVKRHAAGLVGNYTLQETVKDWGHITRETITAITVHTQLGAPYSLLK